MATALSMALPLVNLTSHSSVPESGHTSGKNNKSDFETNTEHNSEESTTINPAAPVQGSFLGSIRVAHIHVYRTTPTRWKEVLNEWKLQAGLSAHKHIGGTRMVNSPGIELKGQLGSQSNQIINNKPHGLGRIFSGWYCRCWFALWCSQDSSTKKQKKWSSSVLNCLNTGTQFWE